MTFRIETSEAFEAFGIERLYDMDDMASIPKFWCDVEENGQSAKLLLDAGDEANAGVSPLIGVCDYRATDDGKFPYMIGSKKTAESMTDGYVIAKIPAATWAIFTSEAQNDFGVTISKLFNHAFNEWLPSSDYVKAAAPDLELYLMDENGARYDEVWIPVVAK